jgi:anti-sigma regulatory factor (Ser/Thr protein kinase)
MLLYTDGLVEVRGEPLHDGLDRLAEAIRGMRSPSDLCRHAMLSIASPEHLQDDVALVAIQNAGIPRELKLRLPADPAALAHVRRLLRRWLQDLGASREDVGAITLACGEACANSIEHAYGPGPASFQFEATSDDGVVTLLVRDRGQWRAQRGRDRGRGISIIEASMDEVEIRPGEDGTEVVMRRRLRGKR